MVRYLIKRTHFPAGADVPNWITYAGKRGIIVDSSNMDQVEEFGYTGEKSALRGLRSWEATVEHMANRGEKLILEVETLDFR